MNEAVGIALFALGAALMISILSYTPGDASLNSVGNGAAGNLMGTIGAKVADLALQAFGLAGMLPTLVLTAWAWRMFSKRGVSVWPLRFVLLMLAMILFAIGLDALPAPANWPLMVRLGGVVGSLASAPLISAGQLFSISSEIIAAAAAILAISLLIAALGLSWTEWKTFAHTFVRGLRALVHGAKRSRDAFGVVPAWVGGLGSDDTGDPEFDDDEDESEPVEELSDEDDDDSEDFFGIKQKLF